MFGIPDWLTAFEPGRKAALARLHAIQPAAYARTRNQLDGAVTGLSPYLTHGVLSLREAALEVAKRHALSWDDKLVTEFAWRAFFQHARQQAGDSIMRDMWPSAVGLVGYARDLPADIREGRTGVAAIDAAVLVLYQTGYLHNHARLWLASYCVHVRKVHWRAGADWMLGHLIDGDLASNHLNWQWVAGTFSAKPYLFNADNVAKFAPRGPGGEVWLSDGSFIDNSYEALKDHAFSGRDAGAEPSKTGERGARDAVIEPELFGAPPADLLAQLPIWDAQAELPGQLHIVHPWSIRREPTRDDAVHFGLIIPTAHATTPWSARRWAWVLGNMARVCDAIFIGEPAMLETPPRAYFTYHATLEAAYAVRLQRFRPEPDAMLHEAPLFASPAKRCRSFSQFYAAVQREMPKLGEALK